MAGHYLALAYPNTLLSSQETNTHRNPTPTKEATFPGYSHYYTHFVLRRQIRLFRLAGFHEAPTRVNTGLVGLSRTYGGGQHTGRFKRPPKESGPARLMPANLILPDRLRMFIASSGARRPALAVLRAEGKLRVLGLPRQIGAT